MKQMCWRKPNPCCIKDDFIGPIPDFLIFWFFFFLLTKQILLNEIGPHDVKKKKKKRSPKTHVKTLWGFIGDCTNKVD